VLTDAELNAVLISITSGLTDYNLESSIEDRLLYDMMEMTNRLDAWLITNGSCRGFAKRVGYYRSKYAVTTPLIGICSTPQPPTATQSLPSASRTYLANSQPTNTEASAGWMQHVDGELDRNHSHFILASNARMGGRQQTKLRSAFEACVGQSSNWAKMQDYIRNTVVEQDVEWPPHVDDEAMWYQHRHVRSEKAADIPVVNVCVQGGHESIRTMLNSVNEALPVLLVRGTGKATDLVADSVCFKFPVGHPKYSERYLLSPKQRVLYDFLESIRVQAGEILPKLDFFSRLDFYQNDQAHPWKTKHRDSNPPLDDPSGHGYTAVIQLLKHSPLLDASVQIEIECRAKQVLGAYDVTFDAAHEEARKVLMQVLLTAKTKFCWVYDLEVGRPAVTNETRVSEGHTHCILQHTTTHCNTLQHTAPHCNTRQHTKCSALINCNTLQHTAHLKVSNVTHTAHCNTLQHIATHCNTLQHTATHCNSLHHTAYLKVSNATHTTHCNTL